MVSAPVLLLPGWKNSSAGHWQSLWESAHGYARVQQHDWMRPLRGDWIARLEEVLLSHGPGQPVVLVAHSLGCQLVAAWAAHSANTHLVQAALLVAPPDTERDDVRQMLPGWAPVPRQALPFSSVALVSNDDPFCALPQAEAMARHWGAALIDTGACGHLNADSNLGEWPWAHAHLQTLRTHPPGRPAVSS